MGVIERIARWLDRNEYKVKEPTNEELSHALHSIERENKSLRDELQKYKDAEAGRCIQGAHCNDCVNALGDQKDFLMNGVSVHHVGTCRLLVPCKNFKMKNDPLTDDEGEDNGRIHKMDPDGTETSD